MSECFPFFFFFFNDTATTEIYTLSLHDALPISAVPPLRDLQAAGGDRRPAGRRAHRCASRDGRRAEVIPRLADGPRPQSLGRGARSRVEAEDGLHAATRGDRAGQRREAYAAGIEAAVVSDRDVPSSPVKALFLPLDSLRFAPIDDPIRECPVWRKATGGSGRKRTFPFSGAQLAARREISNELKNLVLAEAPAACGP